MCSLNTTFFSQRVEIKHDKILGRNYRYITISDRMEAFNLERMNSES